ncbi:hypothetical protein BH10ACT7_BH10ACT7_25130 [soil metagenome]
MARTKVVPSAATRTLALVGLGWVGICWALLGVAHLLRDELPSTLTIIGFSKYGGGHESTTPVQQFFVQSAIVLGVATVVGLALVLVGWRVAGITFIASIFLCAVLPSAAGVLVVTLAWQLGMVAQPNEVPFGIWALGLLGFAVGLIAGFTSAFVLSQRAEDRENAAVRKQIIAKRRR